MPLPTQLQQTIGWAYTAMLEHPRHELLPFYRRGIYNSIGPRSHTQTRRVRTMLDLLTARRVLPLWQKERPNDPWAERLLATSEGVLLGKVTVEEARAEGDEAWNQWEAMDTDPEQPNYEDFSIHTFGAISAAIEALFAASRRCRFDGGLITNQDTDANIDPWSSDTAKWASTAYAGAVWESDSDPIKRKEFWEWWLLEAIPEAWQAAQGQQ